MIHQHLYRARLALLGAALTAVVLVAVEFPLSLLLHQRSEIRITANQLSVLNDHNAGLQSDIHALSNNATVAEIAHEDYGLVNPGQLSYVILPPAGSAAANSLGTSAIPPRDLVGNTDEVTPTASPTVAKGPGLWSRFVNRLEFWH